MSFALISLPERSKPEFTRKHRDLVDNYIVETAKKFMAVNFNKIQKHDRKWSP